MEVWQSYWHMCQKMIFYLFLYLFFASGPWLTPSVGCNSIRKRQSAAHSVVLVSLTSGVESDAENRRGADWEGEEQSPFWNIRHCNVMLFLYSSRTRGEIEQAITTHMATHYTPVWSKQAWKSLQSRTCIANHTLHDKHLTADKRNSLRLGRQRRQGGKRASVAGVQRKGHL